KPQPEVIEFAIRRALAGVPTRETKSPGVQAAPLGLGHAVDRSLPVIVEGVARGSLAQRQHAVLEELDELVHDLEHLQVLELRREINRLHRPQVVDLDLDVGLGLEIWQVDVDRRGWNAIECYDLTGKGGLSLEAQERVGRLDPIAAQRPD